MKHALSRLLLASALGAGCCALPAWSEELGQVRFTFDGVDHTWYTLIHEVRGTPRPSAQLSSRSIADSIDIDVFPDPGAATLERLSLSWMYPRSITQPGPPDYTRATGLSITLLPGIVTGPQWVSRNAQLHLTTIEREGDPGHLAGAFTAELCYVSELYGDPDKAPVSPSAVPSRQQSSGASEGCHAEFP